MKQSSSSLLKIAGISIILLSLWHLGVALYSLNTPFEHHGEFDAMHNFFESVFLFLICALALVQLLCGFFLFKLKRGAYITVLLTLLILIPLSSLVKTPDWVFCLSEANCLSWIKEVIPVLLVASLLYCWKEFWKPKATG